MNDKNRTLRLSSLLAVSLVLVACGGDDGGDRTGDTSTTDASTSDTATDTTEPGDTTTEDTSTEDTATPDAGPADTSTEDTATPDAGPADTSTEDTATPDAEPADTSIEDTSADDTSIEDTSTEDTSAQDTSTEDTSAQDTSADDASADDTSTEDTLTADTGVGPCAPNPCAVLPARTACEDGSFVRYAETQPSCSADGSTAVCGTEQTVESTEACPVFDGNATCLPDIGCVVPARKAVVDGSGNIYALRADGRVYRYDAAAQTTSWFALPPVLDIESSRTTQCALLGDQRSIVCWGALSSIDTDLQDSATPVLAPIVGALPQGMTLSGLSAGFASYAARRSDGTWFAVGTFRQLDEVNTFTSERLMLAGRSAFLLDEDGVTHHYGLIEWPNRRDATPTAFGGEDTFSAFSFGHDSGCALYTDGRVGCFGRDEGRFARPDESSENSGEPVVIQGLPTATAIATTSSGSCALTAAGEVWCWGPFVEEDGGRGPIRRLDADAGIATIRGNSGFSIVGIREDGTVVFFGTRFPLQADIAPIAGLTAPHVEE